MNCWAAKAARSALEELSLKIAEAVGVVVKGAVTWWVNIPSLDPSNSVAVANIRAWVLPIAVAVAIGGFIWQAARLAWLRNADPAMNLSRGTVAVLVTSALSLTAPTVLLKAGDEFSTWVLEKATGGRFAERMTDLFTEMTDPAEVGLVLLLGVVAFFAGLVQWALLFFREGGLIVLVGLAQLAAAGAFNQATRGWMDRAIGWLLAVICWKPLAALVYATAFVLIGEGQQISDVVMGLAMMVLAILVLPLLIKAFNVTGAGAGSGGGGMVGMLAAGGAGAQVMAATRSAAPGPAAGSASDYAAFVGSAAGPGGASGPTAQGGPPELGGPGTGPGAGSGGSGRTSGGPGNGGAGSSAGAPMQPAAAPASAAPASGTPTAAAHGSGTGPLGGAAAPPSDSTAPGAVGPLVSGAATATGTVSAAAQGAASAFAPSDPGGQTPGPTGAPEGS